MGFGWIVILLIVVVFIYFLNQNKTTSDQSARDILDKRYVNGEIDEEEYKRKKEALK